VVMHKSTERYILYVGNDQAHIVFNNALFTDAWISLLLNKFSFIQGDLIILHLNACGDQILFPWRICKLVPVIGHCPAKFYLLSDQSFLWPDM
jgi:hypothetical protein